MAPLVIENESDMLLAITTAGRMLMFPVSDLPELSKARATRSSTSRRRKPRKAKMAWRTSSFCRRRAR
jgi:hypothetical protein